MVEIIRLQQFEQGFTDDCRYIGLVATKDKSQPEIVVLEKGNDLEVKHARTYRVMMKNKVNDVQSYTNFWEPFEKELYGKKTIYVSLDGVYNQVNLNTLKKTGNDYLIKNMISFC